MPRKWNDKELILAVQKENSIKKVLKRLGLYPGAGNYPTIKRHIDRLGLDTSHWRKRKQEQKCCYNNEQIFIQHSFYNKCRLKTRILEDHLIEFKCQHCGIIEWQGEILSLHLDHINGDCNDNRIENLRFLCPNCHSLTENYCGKALRKPPPVCLECKKPISKQAVRCNLCASRQRIIQKSKHCIDCNKLIDKRAQRCKSCEAKCRPTKICWPSLEKLLEMLKTASYVEIGKKLGVSDNSVRKRIRYYKDKEKCHI